MEAVGLGLAVLPLGVKLYKSTRDYLDGLDCADHELATAAAQLECLAGSLDLVEDALKTSGPLEERAEKAAKRQIALIRGQIDQLDKLLAELTQNKAGSENGTQTKEDLRKAAPRSPSLKNRWKQKRKKFAYPFHRENLRRLEDGLTNLNTSLSISLQGLNYRQGQARDAAQLEETTKVLAALSEIQSSIPDAQNIAEAMLRLTIKPQALVAAGEALGVTNDDIATATEQLIHPGKRIRHQSVHSDKFCTCSVRKKMDRSSWAVGPVSLATTTQTQDFHEPSCRMAKFQQRQSAKTYTLSLRTYLQSSMATLISFSLNFSSGGNNQWTRACQLRTFNLRDGWRSPLNKLVSMPSFREDISQESLDILRQYWRYSVLRLFEAGKASPNDVDLYSGGTALHWLILESELSSRMSTYEANWLQTRLYTLQELGVSADLQASRGTTPTALLLHRLALQNTVKAYTQSNFPFFLQWITDNARNTNTIDIAWIGFRNFRDQLEYCFSMAHFLSDHPDMLDVINVGPLSRAIILRNESESYTLIDQHTASWAEEFPGKDSHFCALHLAMLWLPSVAQKISPELVESGSISLDGSSRFQDWESPSLLLIAIQCLVLRKRFTAIQDWNWSDTCVGDHLKLIHWVLRQDCPVFWTPDMVSYLSELTEDESSTSYLLLDLIIASLANRRERLSRFAKSRLSSEEILFLGMNDQLLIDGSTLEVAHVLVNRGVEIPTALLPADQHSIQRGQFSTRVEFSTRVYANSVFGTPGVTPRIAERLIRAGFDTRCLLRDLFRDTRVAPGVHRLWLYGFALRDATPSSISERAGTLRFNSDQTYRGPERKPNTSGRTLFHHFMLSLGYCIHNAFSGYSLRRSQYIQQNVWEVLTQVSSQMQLFLTLRLQDSCHCGCSPSGCLPLHFFIGAASSEIHESLLADRVKYTALLLDRIFPVEEIPEHLVDGFIRCWTFSYLECRHTCCMQGLLDDVDSLPGTPGQDDEAEYLELRQEDTARLKAVEKVTSEVLCAFRGKSITLSQIMVDEWLPTVSATSEALAKAEAEMTMDMERLDELGVSLEFERGSELGLVDATDEWESGSSISASDGDLSDVSSIELDSASGAERNDWELRHVSAAKRAMDRICGQFYPQNGEPTGRVRGRIRKRRRTCD